MDRSHSISLTETGEGAGRLATLARRLASERDALQAIMENTDTQIAYLDREFNFVRVNAAYARGCGMDKKAIIGRNHFDLFPHDENRAIFEAVRDSGELQSFRARPFVFPQQPELGVTYWDWTLAPILDKNGQVRRLVLSLQDVTQQERAQQSLRETTERLNILHKIDQAILKAESKEAIAKAAISYIPRMIDCLRSDVVLFDRENKTLTILATYAEGGNDERAVANAGWRMALEEVWQRLVSRMGAGETVVIDDIAALDVADPFSTLLKDQGVRSLIRQPIRHSGELLGMLQVGRPQVGPMEPKLLDLTRELGDQLAIALRQARFHEELQDHTETLERRVAWRTAALRISEARFRAIFEDAPMGIALLDRQGQIIQHNGALQRILAQEKSAIHEEPLITYMVDEDAAAERERYAALLRGNDKGYQADVRFEHPEHRVIWCTLTVAQIRDVEHQARLAISMVEDITDKRTAQAALVQTEKLALTGQLAASLAHEINNPLQTVIGCLGLAQEDLSDRKSVEVYLEMASNELRRAANIVARLRDMNSPSNPEDKEPTRISDLVNRVKAVTEKQTRDRNIRVHVVEASPISPIPVVPDRIQQVFLNLVLNAIDAMPDGGELKISLAELDEPRGCRIAFEDTGVGIPPEVQIDLFSPFHTTKSEGLGLGLFISQTIIEEHGGTIEVESQPGEGTTFTIWLPA